MESRQSLGGVFTAVCAVGAMIAFYANIDPVTIAKNLAAAGFPRRIAQFISTLPEWAFDPRVYLALFVVGLVVSLWPDSWNLAVKDFVKRLAGKHFKLSQSLVGASAIPVAIKYGHHAGTLAWSRHAFGSDLDFPDDELIELGPLYVTNVSKVRPLV